MACYGRKSKFADVGFRGWRDVAGEMLHHGDM